MINDSRTLDSFAQERIDGGAVRGESRLGESRH
jgi:hypothetical protein